MQLEHLETNHMKYAKNQQPTQWTKAKPQDTEVLAQNLVFTSSTK